MISRVYAKESKRITFGHRITSLRESTLINNQNQRKLCQTGSDTHTVPLKALPQFGLKYSGILFKDTFNDDLRNPMLKTIYSFF
jgi:hypothetical protein